MRLNFKTRYLSITDFAEVDLPQMTVIVGPNGSGKSHLLQAIQNGSVTNSVVAIAHDPVAVPNNTQVRLLTLGDPAPNFGNGYATARPEDPTRWDHFAVFSRVRTAELAPFRAELEALSDGRLDALFPGREVWQVEPAEIAEILGKQGQTEAIAKIFQRAEAELRRPRENHWRPAGGLSDAAALAVAQQVSKSSGIPMYGLQIEHMKLFEQWGQVDPFAVNLPMIFGRYRDAQLRNWMLQKADQRSGDNRALSDEQFVEKFGPPPWTLITPTLAAFSLPYELTTPTETDYSNVSVEFRRTDNRDIVHFQNLSSGERILAQLAISTFHYDERFLSLNRPKVLLLDEMDSSLHPAMVARWLSAIQHELVEHQGMHCILATHSPTTVALTPEHTLFEMVDGRSGLRKISKQDALNKLTFGVPTLSIDYSGRRQVFTESDTDAAIYESVYALIKSHIKCSRELNFLSTGLRDKNNGEINAGCQIVKLTVGRLAESGNSSIFGIIDWDGKATSTDRIKVVAGGERNGIENVLLDPLLVCLLLMKECRLPEGLDDIDRFAGAGNLSEINLQRLIDAVQLRLFPDSAERVEVQYLGSAKCFVLRAYLQADDHVLEDALCEQFDGLKKWHRKGKGHGTLVRTVVEHVLREHSYFCPMALPAVFEAIGNA
ncbi:ATP-binding protein [Bradyrhizobium cenepequi]|uniref:ATP-binding protein n=1 Tax=Bradyrhizobium cenepequi TaxID=2821403 RepID=UPI001CE2DBC1|nr:ATP-binding protein [Bradyrhizobium cenepequi]MCA6107463.1 AAA family ATPase [Bradyrhizobium cenepequi]